MIIIAVNESKEAPGSGQTETDVVLKFIQELLGSFTNEMMFLERASIIEFRNLADGINKTGNLYIVLNGVDVVFDFVRPILNEVAGYETQEDGIA